MALIDLIEEISRSTFSDEDGHPLTVRLLPGLSRAEIETFAATLPCPLPVEVRALLERCSGIDGMLEGIDFCGRMFGDAFGQDEFFPHALPIAHDGFGNYWIIDLLPDSTTWGPIYFACHDAPVMLYQGPDLADFLRELIRYHQPPYKSLIDDVHEDRLFNVWATSPGVMEQTACLLSEDPVLRTFAEELDQEWRIIDLRNAVPGQGFAWGIGGPNTEWRRHGTLAVFANKRKKGWLERLLKR